LEDIAPCKDRAWKINFLLVRPIFRGYVSFREGNPSFIWIFLASVFLFFFVNVSFFGDRKTNCTFKFKKRKQRRWCELPISGWLVTLLLFLKLTVRP